MFEIFITADLVDWWGLSLQQSLLLGALILILIDVFFQTDVTTHVAYVLAAVAVATWLPVPPLWQVVAGLLAWAGFVYIHYALWRDVMASLANRIVAPTKYRGGVQGLIGEIGEVKQIDGKSMLQVRGDVWPFECDGSTSAGDRVRVTSERDGILFVEPTSRES